MQAVGGFAQAGNTVDVVGKFSGFADGVEPRLSGDMELLYGVGACSAGFEYFHQKLAVGKRVSGKLRVAVNGCPVALFPAHHNGFPPCSGIPADIVPHIRFVRKPVKPA